MAELIERVSSTLNPKIHSDSGYGSNKSNSQSQRSSGSSKSQQSSLSSGSGKGYPPHPNAPVSNADCQPHGIASPGAGSTKRQGKKKNKLDRKPSCGDKTETRTCHDGQSKDAVKVNGGSQPMEIGVLIMPNTPQPQCQMSPASKASSTHGHDSKALQVAALTHALSSMKKFQEPISESEANDETEDKTGSTKIHWQDYFSENFKDASNEDAFASVVSLEDGMVVYVTPTINQILGSSFIDFVHPKDRMAFTSHITSGINFPIGEHTQLLQAVPGPTIKTEPFYCRLKQYSGGKTVGFGVVDQTILHHPFKLTMAIKNVEAALNTKVTGPNINDVSTDTNGLECNSSEDKNGVSMDWFGKSTFISHPGVHSTVYLVIVATRIKSAYQYPEEVPKNPGKFVTRHSATCNFGHIDAEAISYLGHLPQDLIGKSVLDYYHPEDMPLLKDIYEAVMQEQGKPFRSKPYRFRVFNGSFVLLETDWSCFINPWSSKLEFIIGQHRVVQGPMNPNVFMQPPKEEYNGLCKSLASVISAGKEMQGEIREMLNETVTRRLSDPLRQQQSSRRRKDLAALMETLLEQMAKTENSDKSGSQCSDFSVMERDSVMLGEISPHHDDHSSSNQSSSTPPSYNQLNYRENIERFFQSQPKTVRSDESVESRDKNGSSDSGSKSSPLVDYNSSSNIRNSSGTSNESGADCLDSSVQYGSTSSLTQELLTRHNEDMEKNMVQRHKESRGTHGSHKESRQKHSDNIPFAEYPISRSVGASSDFFKYSRTLKTKKNIQKVCSASYFCHKHTKKNMPEDQLFNMKFDVPVPHGLKRAGNFSWDGDCPNAKQPHLDHTAFSGMNPGDPPEDSIWPPFSICIPRDETPSFSSTGHYGYHYIDSNGFQQCSLSTSYVAAAQTLPVTPNKVSTPTYTNTGTPLIFVPGQHPVIPQQVQVLPAGVVYQTISPQLFGQHPQFLIPMGTNVHPEQTMTAPTGAQNVTGAVQNSMGITCQTNKSVFPAPIVSNRRTNPPTSFGGVLLNAGISSVTLSNSTAMHINPCVTSSRKLTRSSQISLNQSGSTNPGQSKASTSQARVPGLNCYDGCSESIRNNYMAKSIDNLKGSSEFTNTQTQNFNTKGPVDWRSSVAKLEECQAPLKTLMNKETGSLDKDKMSDEITFRYTVEQRQLSDILQEDLKALKKIGQQSPLVNDQLSMLYDDLTVDGFSITDMELEEPISNSSEEPWPAITAEVQPKKKTSLNNQQYGKMVIIHEENAPFPPESFTKQYGLFKPSTALYQEALPKTSSASS